jgi:hypothetical protein
MKKRLGLILLLGVVCALIADVLVSILVLPSMGHERFCRQWKTRFENFDASNGIPSSWKEEVAIREFPDGWVIAAMHHGCSYSGGIKQFNATIFKDSQGNSDVVSWSPCSGTLSGMAGEWERMIPARDFQTYLRAHSEFIAYHSRPRP